MCPDRIDSQFSLRVEGERVEFQISEVEVMTVMDGREKRKPFEGMEDLQVLDWIWDNLQPITAYDAARFPPAVQASSNFISTFNRGNKNK
jgi:hypothetical protein